MPPKTVKNVRQQKSFEVLASPLQVGKHSLYAVMQILFLIGIIDVKKAFPLSRSFNFVFHPVL